jgi:hypothetical protein
MDDRYKYYQIRCQDRIQIYDINDRNLKYPFKRDHSIAKIT